MAYRSKCLMAHLQVGPVLSPMFLSTNRRDTLPRYRASVASCLEIIAYEIFFWNTMNKSLANIKKGWRDCKLIILLSYPKLRTSWLHMRRRLTTSRYGTQRRVPGSFKQCARCFRLSLQTRTSRICSSGLVEHFY